MLLIQRNPETVIVHMKQGLCPFAADPQPSDVAELATAIRSKLYDSEASNVMAYVLEAPYTIGTRAQFEWTKNPKGTHGYTFPTLTQHESWWDVALGSDGQPDISEMWIGNSITLLV